MCIASSESIKTWNKSRLGHTPACWLGVYWFCAQLECPLQASDLCQRNVEEANRLAMETKAANDPLSISGRYAIPIRVQERVLIRKFFISYWRAPQYNLVRMVLTLIIALVYGSIYWGAGDVPKAPERANVNDVQNIMGILYSSVSFMGMSNMMNILPVLSEERAVFYRERASSMYSSFPYAIAAGTVEIPFVIVQVQQYCYPCAPALFPFRTCHDLKL